MKKNLVPANFREEKKKQRKNAVNMERASFETGKYAAWEKMTILRRA